MTVIITSRSTKVPVQPSVQSLSLSQYLSYVAPTVMITFLWGPIGILQGIYAKYYGVALTSIAAVLLISRLFDAVTDPLIGYWSDRYQAKSGTRKPFIAVGGLLFIISSYCLYVPVEPSSVDVVKVVSTSYFLMWFLLFYLAWTLLETPHMAWAAELTPTSQAKNRIYSLRTLSSYLGILGFYLVPFLPIFQTREFTPQTLQWAVVIAGLFMLPALYLCLKHTPNGPRINHQRTKEDTLWALRKEIWRNKQLLLFVTAYFLFSGGSGAWFALIFIVVDSYLKLGHHFAMITLIALVTSIVSLGGWYWLSNRLGKKSVWGMGAFVYAMSAVFTGFLEPEQAGFISLTLVILFAYIGSGPNAAMAPALLADIIDYSSWKFGADRAATYFSLYTFAAKTSAAVGASLGLGIVGWYGFNPTIDVQTDGAIFGLRLVVSWLSALLMLLSIFVIKMIPMNARRHRIVRRRLDSRLLRESGRSDQCLENKNNDANTNNDG